MGVQVGGLDVVTLLGAVAGCHCWAAIAGCHCWVPLLGIRGGVHVGGCHCWAAIAGCHCWGLGGGGCTRWRIGRGVAGCH